MNILYLLAGINYAVAFFKIYQIRKQWSKTDKKFYKQKIIPVASRASSYSVITFVIWILLIKLINSENELYNIIFVPLSILVPVLIIEYNAIKTLRNNIPKNYKHRKNLLLLFYLLFLGSFAYLLGIFHKLTLSFPET